MSYEATLQSCKDSECQVVIERADAEDLVGTVEEVNDDGCYIRRNPPTETTVTFVSFRDIRGVSTEEWDLKNEG